VLGPRPAGAADTCARTVALTGMPRTGSALTSIEPSGRNRQPCRASCSSSRPRNSASRPVGSRLSSHRPRNRAPSGPASPPPGRREDGVHVVAAHALSQGHALHQASRDQKLLRLPDQQSLAVTLRADANGDERSRSPCLQRSLGIVSLSAMHMNNTYVASDFSFSWNSVVWNMGYPL
jgi:hypothetical protein